MYKIKNVLLTLAIFCLAGFFSTADAQMKHWTYTQYGMGFQLPSYMNVTTNNNNQFVASGGAMSVMIEPWNDASASASDIARRAYDRTNATNKYVEYKERVNLNGYDGYVIVGDGMQNGKALVFVTMGMIDPSSATNFLVTILFWDDPSQHDYLVDTAVDIMGSFYKK
ncbi:MAG: hypothetical protein JJT94_06325 [Bernardetiaceae bacterium]|nr:hypothetical protein [Bernardetiaceae bacterium]